MTQSKSSTPLEILKAGNVLQKETFLRKSRKSRKGRLTAESRGLTGSKLIVLFYACRPRFLVASAAPVLVGSALGYATLGTFNVWLGLTFEGQLSRIGRLFFSEIELQSDGAKGGGRIRTDE